MALGDVPDRPFARLIIDKVRAELGGETRIQVEAEGGAVWVSFRIDEDEYWVAMPRARIERYFKPLAAAMPGAPVPRMAAPMLAIIDTMRPTRNDIVTAQ